MSKLSHGDLTSRVGYTLFVLIAIAVVIGVVVILNQ